MTLAYWMVLLAAVLPLAFAATAKAGGERYDNRRPREWLEARSGWRLRAHWAQQNSYEAFPPFAAAVIIAHQLEANQAWVDTLALLFIGFRILYGALYIADRHVLRSLAWTAGFACVVGLFILSM